MSNTIELLETIGRDASLRHASRENLSEALCAMSASDGLKLALSSNDRTHLAQELGAVTIPPPNHNPHNGGCCGDEEGVTDEDGSDPVDGDDVDKGD